MPFRITTFSATAFLWFVLTVSGLALAPGNAIAKVGEENKITCIYAVWVGYGPIHLAKELGYFKEEGIEVEEIIDDDMPNAIAAMERGDIDCYLRTVGEYQGLGRRKETQGTIIGTIDISTGGDGWAADASINSVCDLKGKTIAVEPNLPARLILQIALKKECNLSIKDTKLSDIAAADAVGVFSDPNVAAVGTYEPVLSQVVATHKDRGAHILVSSKEYNDLILDIIMPNSPGPYDDRWRDEKPHTHNHRLTWHCHRSCRGSARPNRRSRYQPTRNLHCTCREICNAGQPELLCSHRAAL